jgi:arylsulfatase A-like enzyme
MLTGLYPATHGWMPPNDRQAVRKSFTKLDDELVTLAEVFKQNGYRTAGASANPWITEEFGYSQGFDSFWYRPRVQASEIVKTGMRFVDSMSESGKPFFLYMHFLDPHDPYNPPDRYKAMFDGAPPSGEYHEEEQRKMNLYDAEIRYMDSEIGRFLTYLKEKGLYDDMSIIVVADHGEQFMEHGNQGHGWQLYNEEVHVPLFIKTPKQSTPKVIDVTASTVDIFPTALALADILPPKAVPGVSLLDEQALSERKGVFTEINRRLEQRAFTTPDGVKLIVQEDPEAGEKVLGVFDRRKDPLEKSPIADKDLVLALSSELNEARTYALDGRIQPESARGQLKDSTVEHLKSLGYLQ